MRSLFDRVAPFIVAAAVALLVVAVALIGWGVWETHQTVTEHNTELTQIKNNLAAIRGLTQQFANDRGLIVVGTEHGLADYQAICNAENVIAGHLVCTLPYPAP